MGRGGGVEEGWGGVRIDVDSGVEIVYGGVGVGVGGGGGVDGYEECVEGGG